MREIKFRIWDITEKEMIYPDLYWFEEEGIREVPGDAYGYQVMQFTGLQDKNGKDIYEGDICKIEDGMVYSSVAHRMIEGHYQVYWNTDRWGLQVSQFEDYDNGDYYHGSEITWQECEIIGNIYEHSELLQKAGEQ